MPSSRFLQERVLTTSNRPATCIEMRFDRELYRGSCPPHWTGRLRPQTVKPGLDDERDRLGEGRQTWAAAFRDTVVAMDACTTSPRLMSSPSAKTIEPCRLQGSMTVVCSMIEQKNTLVNCCNISRELLLPDAVILVGLISRASCQNRHAVSGYGKTFRRTTGFRMP